MRNHSNHHVNVVDNAFIAFDIAMRFALGDIQGGDKVTHQCELKSLIKIN